MYMLIEQTSQSFMIYILWWAEYWKRKIRSRYIMLTIDPFCCVECETAASGSRRLLCWQNLSIRKKWRVKSKKKNLFFAISIYRYQRSFSTVRSDRTLRQRHRSERFALSVEWDKLLIWLSRGLWPLAKRLPMTIRILSKICTMPAKRRELQVRITFNSFHDEEKKSLVNRITVAAWCVHREPIIALFCAEAVIIITSFFV